MKKRQQRLERIRAVEREFLIARLALDYFKLQQRSQPELMHDTDLEIADLNRAVQRLEGRYFTSLFAEFEAGCRDVWENFLVQSTVPRMRDLIDGLGSRRSIPASDQQDAHDVREYRNSVIHERNDEVDAMPIRDATNRLCKFFRWMPLDW